ncbi:MAG: AAA family ATPase, partial [Aliifodinibius sp.]|nr:AAA family ATPase [Fodinibius sp.]
MAKREINIPLALPHNIEAEKKVLGACLRDLQAYLAVKEILSSEDFYQPTHACIYQAIELMVKNNKPIDLVTFSNRLEKMGQLEKVGGSFHLAEIAQCVATTTNAEYHAAIVKELSDRRKIIRTSYNLINDTIESDETPENLITKYQHQFSNLTLTSTGGYKHLSDSLESAKISAEERSKSENGIDPTKVIRTGIYQIDVLLNGGFYKGGLYILAGETGDGKSALALQLSMSIASIHGPVGYISLEMPHDQLADRFISCEGTIDTKKITTTQMAKKYTDICDRLSTLPIYIDDENFMTYSKLESRAKSLKVKTNEELCFLVVDLLQLIQSEKKSKSYGDGRNWEIGEYTRSLKQLAGHLNIPILALSHLNRPNNKGERKPPDLRRLRESGDIEQNCDGAIFIWCEEESLLRKGGKRSLLLRKHRHGPIGEKKMTFNAEYSRFECL